MVKKDKKSTLTNTHIILIIVAVVTILGVIWYVNSQATKSLKDNKEFINILDTIFNEFPDYENAKNDGWREYREYQEVNGEYKSETLYEYPKYNHVGYNFIINFEENKLIQIGDELKEDALEPNDEEKKLQNYLNLIILVKVLILNPLFI